MPPRTDTRFGTDIQIRTGITGITTGITAIERQIAERKIDWHSIPMPMEKPRLLPGFFCVPSMIDSSEVGPVTAKVWKMAV
jgi:hypothetical protein